MSEPNGTGFGTTKERAYEICRNFLGGVWQDVNCSDMGFGPITGGLNNALFLCSLPESRRPRSTEPSRVLLRIYEGPHPCLMTESVIFTIFSERGLGPRLYGIFPEGRLEEYIPARSLANKQLSDPDISTAIARKMAKVHSLNAPVSKKPNGIFINLRTWLKELQSDGLLDKLSGEKKAMAEKAMSHDWAQELDWLESFLMSKNSPVVFSHNDLQEGNILLPDGPGKIEDRLVFIDFEYAGYNYRGFDIANHFVEWSIDYLAPTYPHYTFVEKDYPTHEEQLRFVRAYLDELGQGKEESESERSALEEKVLEEARAFTLPAHLCGVFWSLMQGCTSDIPFGFLEHCLLRFNEYFGWKESLLNREAVKAE